MKITLDTETNETLCPPEFFAYIRSINDAAELTGGKNTLTPEAYLDKLVKDCSKKIVNKKEKQKARTKTSKASRSNKIGTILGA